VTGWGLRRAAFLDRDGVLNRMVYHAEFGLVDSPQRVEELALLPGVGEAVRRINELGLLAIVVTNQPGVAKGKCSLSALGAINERLERELALAGAHLDGIYQCLHHPEALREEYRVVCECRKPKAGLLVRAAREHGVGLNESFMIGDGLTDVLAGRAAGCRTVLLGHAKCDVCRQMDELDAHPDFVLPDLAAAVALIAELIGR
jgi:D-glycero-D-manno-heptose 1,7-bisphosphate phosphatase